MTHVPLHGRNKQFEVLTSHGDWIWGRDPAELRVTVLGARPEPEALETLEGEGVERVAFTLPPAKRDEVLRLLDAWIPLVPEA